MLCRSSRLSLEYRSVMRLLLAMSFVSDVCFSPFLRRQAVKNHWRRSCGTSCSTPSATVQPSMRTPPRSGNFPLLSLHRFPSLTIFLLCIITPYVQVCANIRHGYKAPPTRVSGMCCAATFSCAALHRPFRSQSHPHRLLDQPLDTRRAIVTGSRPLSSLQPHFLHLCTQSDR